MVIMVSIVVVLSFICIVPITIQQQDGLQLSTIQYKQILENCQDSNEPDSCVACASSDMEPSLIQNSCIPCANSKNPWTCMLCLSSTEIQNSKNKQSLCLTCANSNAPEECSKCMNQQQQQNTPHNQPQNVLQQYINQDQIQIQNDSEIEICVKCAGTSFPDLCKQCMKNESDQQRRSSCHPCTFATDFEACSYCYSKNMGVEIKSESCQFCSDSINPYECADCLENNSQINGDVEICFRI